MLPSGLFLAPARFLLTPAVIFTLYLYFYPVVQQCSFPEARRAEAACHIPGQQKPYIPSEEAPFRLLAFGDPQLEGDTSLPKNGRVSFERLKAVDGLVRSGRARDAVTDVVPALWDVIATDVPRALRRIRKRIDLWGNDLYLAHAFRLVSWWSDPTHMVVLGDLLGSQWISDEEFGRRSDRFWDTVFKGAEKVPRRITDVSERSERLGADKAWKKRVIAVPGNHDIGYAGDIYEHRIDRFEERFGSVNWKTRFTLENESSTSTQSLFGSIFSASIPKPPELHLIVLNSMNLDDPALKPELQQQSRDFLLEQLAVAKAAPSTQATVLLTHIPLHKKEGVCIDAPLFTYFPPNQGGGIKEQNHLSQHATKTILDGLAGGNTTNSRALILTGHDHYGCDTYHYREPAAHDAADDADSNWQAYPWHWAAEQRAREDVVGVREITVRSMMGSFGGNTGLVSVWFDSEEGEWKFDYKTCVLGIQHIWWAVHVLDLMVIALLLVGLPLLIKEVVEEIRADSKKVKTA